MRWRNVAIYFSSDLHRETCKRLVVYQCTYWDGKPRTVSELFLDIDNNNNNNNNNKRQTKNLETIKTASYFAPVSSKPSRARSFVTSFICEGFGFLGTSGAKPAISWYTINTSLPDTHSTGHWALERNKCNEHYSKTGKGITQSFIWLLKREVWGIPREC